MPQKDSTMVSYLQGVVGDLDDLASRGAGDDGNVHPHGVDACDGNGFQDGGDNGDKGAHGHSNWYSLHDDVTLPA